MPVLMNKGTDPRQAAWLFYTDRATLDGLGAITVSERYDAGVLTVDASDLDAAPKASSEVPVYLAVATLVPTDFDLNTLTELAQTSEDSDTQEDEGDTAADEDDNALPYTPVPAPEGTRIPIGITTVAAARAYIQPREIDGKPWAAELPGLQMLANLVAYMREHGGIPTYTVWHVDPSGILRMAPAKQAKPMAGNVLKCKL